MPEIDAADHDFPEARVGEAPGLAKDRVHGPRA
jgi:hypothetical protein